MNDDGVAWSFVMVVLALLVLAGLWIVMTPFAGHFVDLMNERIAAGTVSDADGRRVCVQRYNIHLLAGVCSRGVIPVLDYQGTVRAEGQSL